MGAVAVVHVPVEDEDALQPVRVDGVTRGDGHVGEQAEAHRGAGGLGVVAGRAVQRGGQRRVAAQQRVDDRDGAPGAVQRRRPGPGRDDRVGVQRPATGLAEPLDRLQVGGRVDRLQRGRVRLW